MTRRSRLVIRASARLSASRPSTSTPKSHRNRSIAADTPRRAQTTRSTSRVTRGPVTSFAALTVDGDVIATTEDHPFWNATDESWEAASDLHVGDAILGADGRRARVEQFADPNARPTLAYNLTAQGVHTYHVGPQAVLVHNVYNPNKMRMEARGQAPPGIKRVGLPHRGIPGQQPHITLSDDLPTLNLDGTWGHLGRNQGRLPQITNRQRRWLEGHEWTLPE